MSRRLAASAAKGGRREKGKQDSPRATRSHVNNRARILKWLHSLPGQLKRTLPIRPATLLNSRIFVLALVLVLAGSFLVFWRIKLNAERQLEAERARLEKQNIVAFEKKTLAPITSKQIELWQSHRSTRDLARFHESYFAATDGGLLELDPSGKRKRLYTVLDGLPESDLLSLASFNSQLFIGTRSQGLVSFNGERFESYRWPDRSPQAINVLLADAGRLLIGTMAGGLIEFDGHQFREHKTGSERQQLAVIIHLSKSDARLFVGTFADGLWIEEGARWSHFTTADGLPSNRIVGVVVQGANLFVASDYGLAAAELSSLSTETPTRSAKLFRSIAVLPSLASIIEFQSRILLCKDNGESFGLHVDRAGSRQPQLSPLGGGQSDAIAGTRFVALEQRLWILNNAGFRSVETQTEEKIWTLGSGSVTTRAPAGPLTSNLISALVVDSRGRVWAGGFRDGIDVLTAAGQRLAHLESDSNREINSLAEDAKTHLMLAATSQGLLSFDTNLRYSNRWSTAEGLLSKSVLHVARMQGDATDTTLLACATSKGLSFGTAGKLHSLTTVQGLPSNSLYTVLAQGRNLYAGTLSGLAVIQDGRVVRVFKDSNSNLSTNWVTALCVVGSRIFVGTYGGGIFELTPAGELAELNRGNGRVVINPNAMWSDGLRLYAGTLNGALMFDLHSQKWTRITAELPSRTVLSVTGDGQYVYFGTTAGIARIEHSYWNETGTSRG